MSRSYTSSPTMHLHGMQGDIFTSLHISGQYQMHIKVKREREAQVWLGFPAQPVLQS